jgi:hypothetical protein
VEAVALDAPQPLIQQGGRWSVLIRAAGHWPAFQTEIHFHPSSPRHREVATDIISYYALVVDHRPNCAIAPVDGSMNERSERSPDERSDISLRSCGLVQRS